MPRLIAICLAVSIVLATGCEPGAASAPRGEPGKEAPAQPVAGTAAPDIAPLPEPEIAPGPERRPNILIFLIDTLRADRVNAYGYEKFVTSPSIDALAAEGVLFEQAYSAAPWTLPAVASLMTGKFLCEHQTIAPRETMPEDLETLPQRLDGLGYNTIGLFANSMVSPKYGFARGYDLYRSSTRNDARKIAPVLAAMPDTPRFLYVHNLEPHNPYHFAPPHTEGFPDVDAATRDRMQTAYKGYRKATRVDYKAERPLGSAHASAEAVEHMAVLDELRGQFSDLYDATVLMADAKFGSTVELFRQRGEWDDMLVIFLSDHGEEFGEHGAWLHDQSLYEEMVRVPLIIKFPGAEFAGQRIATPVSLVDVMPTVAEYLGAPALAAGARGISLLPVIRGEVQPRDDEVYVAAVRHNRERYFEPVVQARGHVNVAVRFQNWKGIWNVEPNTFELYDLVADPGEQRNLAANYPDLVARLGSAARDWYASCQAAALGVDESVSEADFDEETLRNLRTLGYVDDPEPESDEEADEPDPGREP